MSFGSKAAERIANKTVLITGASGGIGYAIAEELASAANGQIKLILASRRLEKLEEVATSLKSKFPAVNVLPMVLDVSDYANCMKKLDDLPAEFAEIDVLVNNAGLAKGVDKVGDIKVSDIETMYFTNVLGLVTLTNALVAKFKARGSGDVVMIGSTAGRETYPGGSIYASTKACLKSFTEALRKETIDTPIRVIEVAPGLVETEFSITRLGDKTAADNVYKGLEALNATDVAEVVVFNLTRRQNTVVAESVVVPVCQACSTFVSRK